MKRATKPFLLVVLATLLVSFSATICASDSDSCFDAPSEVREAIKSNVLILVFAYDDSAKDFILASQGTGVVVAPNYILSAPHVFTGEAGKSINKSRIKIFIRRNMQDSVTWEANIVDYKLSYELALLKVSLLGERIQIQGIDCKSADPKLIGRYAKENSDLSAEERAFSVSVKPACIASSVREGEKIWTNGFTGVGFLNTCYLGSALLVMKDNFITWSMGIDPIQFFQGHLEHGFSGGALFNAHGEVVGNVFAFVAESKTIFMASPSASITDFLNNIKDPDFVKARQ